MSDFNVIGNGPDFEIQVIEPQREETTMKADFNVFRKTINAAESVATIKHLALELIDTMEEQDAVIENLADIAKKQAELLEDLKQNGY